MSSSAITGLDYRLEAIYDEWTDIKGFGPCGHYAAWRQQQDGWAIAVCTVTVSDFGTEFVHYVNIVDGGIYDMSNPFQIEGVTYTDIEILDADETPELVNATSLSLFAQMMAA